MITKNSKGKLDWRKETINADARGLSRIFILFLNMTKLMCLGIDISLLLSSLPSLLKKLNVLFWLHYIDTRISTFVLIIDNKYPTIARHHFYDLSKKRITEWSGSGLSNQWTKNTQVRSWHPLIQASFIFCIQSNLVVSLIIIQEYSVI